MLQIQRSTNYIIDPLEELARSIDDTKIRVLTVPYANKRLQMVEYGPFMSVKCAVNFIRPRGIKQVRTDITVFADDDTIWPATLLPHVLACFEDHQMGGVGTSQRVHPVGEKMTVWEVLAAFRLTTRNVEIAASTHIDGGIQCLSGRTVAYRTVILKVCFFQSATSTLICNRIRISCRALRMITGWENII